MQERPFILMRVGQINLPLRVPISPLLIDAPVTTLSVNTASAVTTLSVNNTAGFKAPYSLLIGEPGNQNSEIIVISSITDATTIVLNTATSFPHSASTNVYLLSFNQVELSNAPTTSGSKTVLQTLNLTADVTTDWNDTVSTGGYYFARFTQSNVGAVSAVTLNTAGSLYVVDDIVTLVGGDNNATAKVLTLSGSGIATVSVVSGGSGYIVATGLSLTGGTGSGGKLNVTAITSFSPYSDPAPYDGYTTRSARQIIDSALNGINKTESQTLTDEFLFQELDNCQTEVLQDLKRWSFMQKFDAIIGNVSTGSWKFTMPTDIGVDYSNKSVYQVRLGTQQRLTWVDKEKFDEFFVGVAYTTLAVAANNADATLTLVDSSDFLSTDSGTVSIGANTYTYTANDPTTGILTLDTPITPTTTAPIGADVFQGATQGLPIYWTTYGGIGYYWPITAPTYDGKNIYMDYYTKQVKIVSDSDLIVFPDPTVAIYYLQWKCLKKLANGADTPDTIAYQTAYASRKTKMIQKEVMNRTFKLRPRIQNFAIQSEFNESTPRWIRDARFPNTGF